MKESLSDKAYEMIKADIISCVFEPGQQIAQPHLAEKYGIGMTPVREALHRLAQEGFVDSVPRYGYVVSPISLSTVVDVYEARLILETTTARLAAARGSREQLERLVENQEFTYTPGERASYLEFLSRNAALHQQIAAASGNEKLATIITQLHEESTRVFHLGLNLEESVEDIRKEHLGLARAINDRDAERAERLMHDHIARTQHRVTEALSRHFGIRPAGGLEQRPPHSLTAFDSQRRA